MGFSESWEVFRYTSDIEIKEKELKVIFLM
jgi:hypothetical protein